MLYIVGSVTMMIAILGAYGAHKENKGALIAVSIKECYTRGALIAVSIKECYTRGALIVVSINGCYYQGCSYSGEHQRVLLPGVLL